MKRSEDSLRDLWTASSRLIYALLNCEKRFFFFVFEREILKSSKTKTCYMQTNPHKTISRTFVGQKGACRIQSAEIKKKQLRTTNSLPGKVVLQD